MSNTVHIVIASKGGVGKSFVSRLLAEHFMSRNITPRCIDLDGATRTFANYEAFQAEEHELLNAAQDIDPRSFDNLIETFVSEATEADNNRPIIVDVGTNTFLPLVSYMVSHKVMPMLLDEMKINVIFHSVIAGGQHFLETLSGFHDLCENFANVRFCVWKNCYQGQMAFKKTKLEDHPVYKKHIKRIHAEVLIPERDDRTFGKDMTTMLANFHTFEEVKASDQYKVMEKHRLARVWAEQNALIFGAKL